MYVMNVRNEGTGSITVGQIAIGVNESANFPAENCLWEEPVADAQGTRRLQQVRYFPYTSTSATTIQTDALTGDNRVVRLGYIGKSGRFVPITD